MNTYSTIYLTFAYKNTTFTRKYAFDVNNDADLNDIFGDLSDNIEALNSSLAGGTAGGLSSFFLSDDGNDFVGIIEHEFVTFETDEIDLSAED